MKKQVDVLFPKAKCYRLRAGMIMWKKVYDSTFCHHAIVKLYVPSGARLVRAFNGRVLQEKLRVDRAKVLEIVVYKRRRDTPPGGRRRRLTRAYSGYDADFSYVVGETVRPKRAFDDSACRVCTSGIHCYRTRQAAVGHYL